MNKCSRCNNERKTQTIVIVRPGAHSMFPLSDSDRRTEYVCGDCLTDLEIMFQLSPAIAYVLGTLLRDYQQQPESDLRNEWLKAIQMTQTQFMTLNTHDPTRNRGAAIRALGLAENE